MKKLDLPTLSMVFAVFALLTLISGCQNNGNESTGEKMRSSVVFDFEMAAFLNQNLAQKEKSEPSGLRRIDSKSVVETHVLRGQLVATNIGGTNDGVQQAFTWTINFNEETFEAESNATLVLEPGEYDLELSVSSGTHQYLAYANYMVEDGENIIPMTIKPVIGEIVADVSVVDELAAFKFNYKIEDVAALVNPKIGLIVDGGDEQIFTINKSTGMSAVFVNLTAGQRTLELRLYDGAVQVGRSVPEQEVQTIAYDADLIMDLVPLHGDIILELTESGGDARISITIPDEIIEEVAGVNNLSAILKIVGPRNPLAEMPLTFFLQQNGDFKSDLVLHDLQYDDVTASIEFADASTGDQVASCNHSWALSTLAETFVCDVTLIRRAVIQGDVLAVLGINTMSEQGLPLAGVVVTNDAGETLGITGTGDFSTAGFLKLLLHSGTHLIPATEPVTGFTQSATVELTPLKIENIWLELQEPPVVEPEPVMGFVGDFAPDKWVRFTEVFDIDFRPDMVIENNLQTERSISSNQLVSSNQLSSSLSSTEFKTTGSNVWGTSYIEIKIPYDGVVNFDWKIDLNDTAGIGQYLAYLIDGSQEVIAEAKVSSRGSVEEFGVLKGQLLRIGVGSWADYSNWTATFNNFTFTEK